ncbi:hypothetical protein [uncultured Ruminococcus sp.]|uniref:hypothetical protein n=1 Tax=uncultured Ruminococcus sp. TaxID=165186 RepID=UPI0025D99F2B|nr:hypothetical protein [uncultured Ruminococcus sp.]
MNDKRSYTIYIEATNYLYQHAIGLTESVLEEYFVNPRKKALNEAFGVVISSAEDWHKPKARNIKYKERWNDIEKVVGNHKLSYVINTFEGDPQKLYSAFTKNISLDSKQFTKDVWLSYANSICGMAQYLSKFKNTEDMYNYFDKFQTPSEKNKLINEVSQQSRIIKTKWSWGFALSANWLKDIGMIDYCKPDIQVTNCLNSLGLCSKTNTVVFKTLVNIAEDSKKYDKTASAFKLDRIIWLIGSGDFYGHPEIKWNGSLEGLVSELKTKIK